MGGQKCIQYWGQLTGSKSGFRTVAGDVGASAHLEYGVQEMLPGNRFEKQILTAGLRAHWMQAVGPRDIT